MIQIIGKKPVPKSNFHANFESELKILTKAFSYFKNDFKRKILKASEVQIETLHKEEKKIQFRNQIFAKCRM